LRFLISQASTGLKELKLSLNPYSTTNLDYCLDFIFSLDQLAILSLNWNQISIEKIKSSLNKQGPKKRLKSFDLPGLGSLGRAMNDVDIFEICLLLPELRKWGTRVETNLP
jgi:hypothetical protein